MRQGCTSALHEVESVGQRSEALGIEGEQETDVSWHEEGGVFALRLEGIEEHLGISQSVEDMERASLKDDGEDLRETADMVERAVDDENQIVRESLSGNQALGIGYNRAMTDHHALRTASGACGV